MLQSSVYSYDNQMGKKVRIKRQSKVVANLMTNFRGKTILLNANEHIFMTAVVNTKAMPFFNIDVDIYRIQDLLCIPLSGL